MRMPDIVVQALALALRYLKQFGLEKVLRLGTTFRPFFTQNEMNLSPNAIRQLEVCLLPTWFFFYRWLIDSPRRMLGSSFPVKLQYFDTYFITMSAL